MTDFERQAAIKKLQLEIDKRCAFFAILTDVKGSNTGKKKLTTKEKRHAVLS